VNVVNHPPHYSSGRFGCECIAITRHMSFDAGNAFKYIWRHEDKGSPTVDLEKAVWYLRDLKASSRGRGEAGVWIDGYHRSTGQLEIRNHVAPRVGDTSIYWALIYVADDAIDSALTLLDAHMNGLR
jgi:hypothetical protein